MVIVCLAGIIASDGVDTQDQQVALVSDGLVIFANKSAMAKSGLTGNDLAFTPDDFERALNLSRVDYITITELPDAALGTLCLGSSPISEGQTVSRENLHKLSYVEKAQGISSNSFKFTTGNGYEIECSVYMLSGINYCPVASGSKLFTSVSTYRNVSVEGKLSGYDADDDEITFEVVSYPKNGFVKLTDEQNGEFCYTPTADYVGEDSFKYVVYDKYGNYSSACEVKVEVKRVSLDGVLCDMGGNYAHSAAISMVEQGIMTASKGESGLVFAPDEKVTREDFLVMAMKAAKVSITESTTSGFADDADVSAMAKSYVYTAKQKGYVNGSLVNGEYCFCPNEAITAAEAAVIVDKIIDGSSYIGKDMAITTVFIDHSDIPAWAEDSILTLNYVGVFSANGGYVYPQKEMTKSSCAVMLKAVMEMSDSTKTQS